MLRPSPKQPARNTTVAREGFPFHLENLPTSRAFFLLFLLFFPFLPTRTMSGPKTLYDGAGTQIYSYIIVSCCGRLGATAAVTPEEAARLAPFDMSLEVTGNPRGLQVRHRIAHCSSLATRIEHRGKKMPECHPAPPCPTLCSTLLCLALLCLALLRRPTLLYIM